MDHVPRDVILTHLVPRLWIPDLCRLARTCKRLQQIIATEAAWAHVREWLCHFCPELKALFLEEEEEHAEPAAKRVHTVLELRVPHTREVIRNRLWRIWTQDGCPKTFKTGSISSYLSILAAAVRTVFTPVSLYAKLPLCVREEEDEVFLPVAAYQKNSIRTRLFHDRTSGRWCAALRLATGVEAPGGRTAEVNAYAGFEIEGLFSPMRWLLDHETDLPSDAGGPPEAFHGFPWPWPVHEDYWFPELQSFRKTFKK